MALSVGRLSPADYTSQAFWGDRSSCLNNINTIELSMVSRVVDDLSSCRWGLELSAMSQVVDAVLSCRSCLELSMMSRFVDDALSCR